MSFGSCWLESTYKKWRQRSTRRLVSFILVVVGVCALVRALAQAPELAAAKQAFVAVVALVIHLVLLLRSDNFRILQTSTTFLLCLSVLLSLPEYTSALSAVVAIFSIYTLLYYQFYISITICLFISILQICVLVFFNETLTTNELLSVILVHGWAHFVGIYLHIQVDRLSRSSFLSSRNSIEAENSAQAQSLRLNKLLEAFLPSHLLATARHQVTLYTPNIYTEFYSQVTVAYGRLIGFEAVLSQCSSLDAARVLKEFDQRIDRLVAYYGCTRIISEGITVVSSIPSKSAEHATKMCQFALDLEALVASFRDSTTADVSLCVGIDTGNVTAGIVGNSKWHYDVIGTCVDNCILLQSNAPTHGVFVTDDTHQLIEDNFQFEKVGENWKILSHQSGLEVFPINKRYSLVTIPQAINRMLQTITSTMKINGNAKKNRLAPSEEVQETSKSSFMSTLSLKFKNKQMEDEYHQEMDHWFIPAVSISIFFLVIYGIYHMLVMPRLVASLLLIIIALTIMFVILLMLYINFFKSFTHFITRTPGGHTITVIIIMLILLICGIVNTFSCPPEDGEHVCRSIHFSAFSFVLWILTTTVFLRFSSLYLLLILMLSIGVYCSQIAINHPPIGPRQFVEEFNVLASMVLLVLVVFIRSRFCELMMRLDFLAVIKGVEESSTKDQLTLLNSQILLNLVPPHVAPWVVMKGNELWHHAHHSVGVAYLAVSGFELEGEQGLNALNYVFSYFDQALLRYKGIEKIKNANRFYIVAVGMLPDAAQNVNETPWTIGELLNTLTQYLMHVTEFARQKEFQVQIGIDCGSTLTLVADVEHPRYELWGETVEKARLLMQSASQDRILVSEEIYLALRPRELHFSAQPMKILSNLNAYVLFCRVEAEDERTEMTSYALPKEEQERHTQKMFEKAVEQEEPPSSMASSFSSELQSMDGGGETDSDIEWITPESALMEEKRLEECRLEERRQAMRRLFWESEYDPYREPQSRHNPPPYKAEHAVQYSDWSEQENSRAPSRTSRASSKRNRRWRSTSKTSLRNALGWWKKDSSMDIENTGDNAKDRLEAASSRVDKMLQELNAYGEFADVKPLEYRPFPISAAAVGSVKSINRAISSACHTEYDNDESEAALSDFECNNTSSARKSTSSSRLAKLREKRRRQRWRRDGTDADAESQCSSIAGSMDLDQQKWKSVHSVGYDNEYEMVLSSSDEAPPLAVEEMKALSRDIRKNFGDFQLATFDDIDQEDD